MTEFVVVREPSQFGCTFGTLYVESPGTLLPEVRERRKVCDTLEDEIRPPGVKVHGQTCIPPGRYRLRLITSPRFGPDTPTLDAVPNFQYIRVHAGNVIEDTDGCLLVGYTRSKPGTVKPWIGQSRAALKDVVALIKGLLVLQGMVYVTIENPPEVIRGIDAD